MSVESVWIFEQFSTFSEYFGTLTPKRRNPGLWIQDQCRKIFCCCQGSEVKERCEYFELGGIDSLKEENRSVCASLSSLQELPYSDLCRSER